MCIANATWALWMFFFEVSYKCWCCSGATKNFKMLLGVVGVFLCVANVVCGVVNVCKCYQVLFECRARCFSQVPPLPTPSLFLLVVLLVLFMVFSQIRDMFFYFLFLNEYEFLKVYTSFVDFVLSF